MAKQQERTIIQGSAYLVYASVWEWQKSNSARPAGGPTEMGRSRIAVEPLAAKVKLMNFVTGETIPIGTGDAEEGVADIDDNEITYVIGPEHFEDIGQYKIGLEVILPDGRPKVTSIIVQVNSL